MRALVLLLVVGCSSQPKPTPAEPATAGLRAVSSFAHLEGAARAQALFQEMGKVIQHPRCVNCHPAGDRPLQGKGTPHHPLVVRGPDNHGAPGMQCQTCHGDANYRTVPGSPKWHLAPLEMAWEGRSLSEICAQLKDPARNGGLDLDALVKHMAEDALVAYGWNPPAHLPPAPGSQALLGELTRAWADAGAHCP